jgi:hypothetical protein
LLQLLRIDAVFGSKLTCRYRGAAQVVAKTMLTKKQICARMTDPPDAFTCPSVQP